MKYLNDKFFSFHLIITAAVLSLLSFSCKQDVYTGTAETQKIQNAKVVIHSMPEGANIYLNGKNMGIKTPDSLSWLSTGNYTITLKLNLFPDRKLPVALNDGQRSDLFYNYFSDPSNFGNINCKSNPPDAEIILNDSATGIKTPSTLSQLFPGQYKIKLNLQGCRSDSSIVTVSGGQTASVYILLEDTTQWVSYKITNSGITSNYLSSVAVDKNNLKWFGTLDKGLASFDGKNWKTYSKANSQLNSDFINCLTIDKNNNLWIATSGGLMTFNGVTWTNYTSNLPSSYVTSVVIDHSGVFWIGTQSGLVKYDGSSWTTINTSNSGIAANFVTGLAIDNSNRLWIGTNAFGICMFDGSNWKIYNMSNIQLNQYLGNSIQDIAVDKDGVVWAAHIKNPMGADLGGVSMFDGNSWSVLDVGGWSSLQLTECLFVDENNYKWIGTKGGLLKLKLPGDITFFTTVNSKMPASQVEGVAIDANGDLWVGTFGGGVGKLKKGNF